MLSLHPQDFNSNPCYLPYRSLSVHSIPTDRSTSSSSSSSSLIPLTMGGAVHHPPTPQEDQHMEVDGPLSSAQNHNSSSSTSPPPPTQASVRPPADYDNPDANTVADALEVARDSPDGACDPVVCGILESALSRIWERVLAGPDSYVMTMGEFAVFNFYQHRFVGNKMAVAARRRFWDHTHA